VFKQFIGRRKFFLGVHIEVLARVSAVGKQPAEEALLRQREAMIDKRLRDPFRIRDEESDVMHARAVRVEPVLPDARRPRVVRAAPG